MQSAEMKDTPYNYYYVYNFCNYYIFRFEFTRLTICRFYSAYLIQCNYRLWRNCTKKLPKLFCTYKFKT